MKPQVRAEVSAIFNEWDAPGVYVLLRGWNGQELDGSDIDLLAGDLTLLEATLQRYGYQRTARRWQLFDLLATEIYFDKTVGEQALRFHLTDRLLFGKPARLVRLPIEAQVLETACYASDVGAFQPAQPYQDLVMLCRSLIDRPQRAATLRLPVSEAALPAQLQPCQKALADILADYQAGHITSQIMRARALRQLRELPYSEGQIRFVQSRVSLLLLGASRLVRRGLAYAR